MTLVEQLDIPPWAHNNGPRINDLSSYDVSGSTEVRGQHSNPDSRLPDPSAPTGSHGPAASDPGPRTASDDDDERDLDDALTGQLVGDGSGMVGWIVDGIPEDSHAEYLQQLQDLAQSKVLNDPPLPEALVIVTVPFLALLGLTGEPAELAGPQGGPIPQDIARKLLANSSSFLRVLTDPISGEALPLDPTRYTVRDSDRIALQAITGGCYVPNCQNPVIDTELDHLRAFEFGGASTIANLRPSCKRHHYMRHYKDDKDRHGQRRCITEPERQGLKLRGWTPKVTNDGRVGWIAPSGIYQPPQNTDPQRPRYPKWLQKIINRSLKKRRD